jgi:general secretion pathway protein N
MAAMRLLRSLALIVVAVAALAAIAAWTCPAGFAYRFAADALRPLQLHDLDGTVWNGHAGQVEVLGRDLGALDWKLQPSALLRGEIAARFVLAGSAVSASGSLRRGAAQTEFRDTVVSRARLDGLRLASAAGTAYWRNAEVAGAAQARLGDLQATFAATAGGGIAGAVHDLGGPLQASGTFSVDPDRYAAHARLAARGGNAQVAEALHYVGQPLPDGSRELEIRGRRLDWSGT